MRKNLRLLFCLLALGAAFAPAPKSAARQGVPRVGGFKPVATTDARVMEAARNAVAAAAKKEEMNIRLLSVVAAEQQVVQGMNYRLCLEVEIEDTENNVDVTTHVSTQVYMSLKKVYQLRSWQEEDCGGEDDEQ